MHAQIGGICGDKTKRHLVNKQSNQFMVAVQVILLGKQVAYVIYALAMKISNS